MADKSTPGSAAPATVNFTDRDTRLHLCSAMGWIITNLVTPGSTIEDVIKQVKLNDFEANIVRQYFGANWRGGV